jgi:mycothiol synthase
VNLPAGYRARPAEPEDLDAVSDLFDAYDRVVESTGSDPMRSYFEWVWPQEAVDLARDTRLVHAGDGSVAAYAEVWGYPAHRSRDAMACVHPQHAGRGLGTALVAWTEGRTAELVAAGASLTTLWNGVSSRDDGAHALLESRGYANARSYFQMRRELDEHEGPGRAAEGIVIRPFADGDERILHDVLERAFSDHFGWEPTPFEQWRDGWMGSPTWEPSMVFLAEAGRVAAGAIAAVDADATIGLVTQLGVLPEHRRRGIATALLHREFAAIRARGRTMVQLGVDAENATGATELYERAGMWIHRQSDVFEKRLDRG